MPEVMSNGNGVIHRRTQAQGDTEQNGTVEHNTTNQQIYQPDRPCHKVRESLFSWNTRFTRYQGFVNWGFLMLFICGLRLMLENLHKYGIRVDPSQWGKVLVHDSPGFVALALKLMVALVFLLFTYIVERGMVTKHISPNYGFQLQILNLICILAVPIIVIYTRSEAFTLFGASTVCANYSMLFMKLVSYIQVNKWCRDAKLKEETEGPSSDPVESLPEGTIQYPENVTLGNLFYFMVIPSFCYELNFPRTPKIRISFVFKRIVEIVIGANIVIGLFQQWIIPAVQNSLIPFSKMDWIPMIERLLKLAIPNHLIWLCFFYIEFHSIPNLLGELTRFADRNFYGDWWNAKNMDEFWRSWNMPVHRWCVRHIYVPAIEMGISKSKAHDLVFVVSSFFHEYLVSVPLRIFRVWAFMGMMSQMPLGNVTRYIERRFGPRMSNMIVWASLIVGQPLCIMMYYHDYTITYYRDAIMAAQ